MICKKNRISSNKINIDKHKDIDGYVSKLTDVIINKKNCWKECMNHHIISEINNKIKMINKDVYKLYDNYIDKIYLINDKLKEMKIQLKQKLKKILV